MEGQASTCRTVSGQIVASVVELSSESAILAWSPRLAYSERSDQVQTSIDNFRAEPDRRHTAFARIERTLFGTRPFVHAESIKRRAWKLVHVLEK